MKKTFFGAALAVVLCTALPAAAQYELAGTITSTTCTDVGGGAVAQETGCLVLNLAPAIGSVSVQITGAYTATLQFEVTDSSTWVSANAYPLPSGVAVTSTANGTGIWQVDTAGARRFRVRASAYTSTPTVIMMASLDSAVAAGGTQTVAGSLTNNNAAPGATNIGALTSIANAAVPTWTEADLVMESVDLSGRQRVTGTVANDTTAIANSLETAPATAAATPTAVTAGRAEKLQMKTTSGGLFVEIVDSGSTRETSVLANDTVASGNGLQVMPGIAKAGPATTTAGRGEFLQTDTVSGGAYVTESPTTNAVGLTTTGIVTVTASQSIKASAGNLYGFGVVNGAGAGCWLQCVNSAGAGTLGTAVIFQAPLPTSATAYSAPGPIPLGSFSTGIACGVASAVNGASACGTAATGVAIYYK